MAPPKSGAKGVKSTAAISQANSESADTTSGAAEINAGPVSALPSPSIVSVENVIDMDHPARHDDTMEYEEPADQPMEQDLPGPSSTYIPRQPSPPLPDLSSRPFPPDEEDDDEEDDEVVAKLPIYLSPSLFPHLHLFQFPLSHKSLSPSTWARDRGKHISTRVKEKVGRVEVEIPVDGGENVWRDERARDLGFVMDVNAVNGHAEDVEGGYSGGVKKKKDPKKNKQEKWGDKTRMRSELVPNATGYYSGVIHDGALHLHPISKVMQFRTNLQYLDDMDTADRERSSRKDNDEDGKATDARAKAAVLQQQSRTRKLHEEQDNDGSGSIKDFRTKMWNTAADEEADPWVPYYWKVDDDDRVAASLHRLYVPEGKREKLECRTKGLDYLNRPEGI